MLASSSTGPGLASASVFEVSLLRPEWALSVCPDVPEMTPAMAASVTAAATSLTLELRLPAKQLNVTTSLRHVNASGNPS